MKNKNTWYWVLGIVVIALVVWAIAGTGGKNKTSQSNEPIKIGVSSPITGEGASYGESAVAGAKLAVKEINDKGGINGRKLKIIYEDDTCSSKGGVSVFSKLINIDKVTAIVGPVCSAAAGPGLPIAQEAKIPVIFFGSAPSLPSIGDYLFRTYPSDSFQGIFASKYIFGTIGAKKVAVLYVKNDWGQGIRNIFVKEYKKLGGEIVYDEGVSQQTKDLKTSISKIIATEPDAIYFPVYPALGIIGLKQMRNMNISIPIFGGDSFESSEIIKSGIADGVLYSVGIIKNPEDFKKKVKDETNINTNIVAPLYYDAIKIFVSILKKVGTNKEAIKSELEKLHYTNGISLPNIEFDKNGDLKSANFEVKIIKNKESIKYEPKTK